MTDEQKPLDTKLVWCRRLEQKLPVREHANCAYCFGEKQKISGSQHEKFCDFKPGEDPINFGFPPDSSRTQSG